MFSPAQQQIEICLLKSNLEEIEKSLVVQKSAVPTLDVENEQKYNETMNSVRVTRALNTEIERLKQESVRLTAKRMQLKRQCEDINTALCRARDTRSELVNLLKQEERDIEHEIRNYEVTLREIADQFRQNPAYVDETELNTNIEIITNRICDLEREEQSCQEKVNGMNRDLDILQPEVREDILDIMGKRELDNKIKELTIEMEAQQSKQVNILKCRGNITQLLNNDAFSY